MREREREGDLDDRRGKAVAGTAAMALNFIARSSGAVGPYFQRHAIKGRCVSTAQPAGLTTALSFTPR